MSHGKTHLIAISFVGAVWYILECQWPILKQALSSEQIEQNWIDFKRMKLIVTICMYDNVFGIYASTVVYMVVSLLIIYATYSD